MALAPRSLPTTASTQRHLDIEDIQDNLVILKDGGVALILETTAVNFGLLSETEQDAAIYAYAGLLNSLTFPVQIVIRSRQMDISSYVQLLKEQEAKQTNDNLRFQISRYRLFIESIIRENNVLDKRFYIVIPFSPLELGAPSAAFSLLGMLNPFSKKGGLPYSKNYIIEKSKNALLPKKDHIAKQLARVGLRAQQLTTQELVELFYDIYNPTQISSQKITASTSDYTTTLVTPAVEKEEQISETLSEPSGPSSKPAPAPVATLPLPQPSLPQAPAPPAPQAAPQTSPVPSPPVQDLPVKENFGQAPQGSADQPGAIDENEPEWLKKIQEKVAEDQASSGGGQSNQPRLARIKPQPPGPAQPQVIGGRVATAPGQVSQQLPPAPIPPERPPTPTEPEPKTNQGMGTIFQS